MRLPLQGHSSARDSHICLGLAAVGIPALHPGPLHYTVCGGVRLRVRAVLAIFLLLGVFGCLGCKPRPAAGERRFPIEGRVVSADAAMQTLTLAHREIPGYMNAMTMSFTVRDAWVFDVVHPGDTVQGTLVVTDNQEHIESLSVVQERGAADLSSTSPVHLPEPGEAVPDFAFLDQNGRPMHLAQFRGEPLLITFIYTRCPLPDYCPRMSNNFAEVAKTLADSNPAAYAKLQMLSITLDPEFDHPAVLRSYGKAYAGKIDPDLKHWRLATGSPAQIRKAAEFFGLSYEIQSGEVIHNLRTALLDRDGKIADFYTGNEWKPDEVAAQLQNLQNQNLQK
jgi:protein SCO1